VSDRLPEADPLDARRALRATGLLRAFNDAGVLVAADVHVGRRLGELGGGPGDGAVALAAALAVRGPRLGHVCVDLASIRETAAVDADEPVDLSRLPWPDGDAWLAALAASALVACGEEDPRPDRPLRLVGSRLYLDRYWREERHIAADLLALAGDAPDVAPEVLADGLDRLFEDPESLQRRAAAAAVLRRFAVVGGGPGTGKTTTVARIVALLAEQAAAAGVPAPLVALAAPTGKAAARLEEAVRAEAGAMRVGDEVRAGLEALAATTLHRLLGWRPGSHSRFRHHRANRLPHDVVVVDESSMVSLSLMGRLVEAVRPGARLVLVGDPGQLTSIEAGAVLGDIVGPVAEGRAGGPVGPGAPAGRAAVGDGIVVLDRVHRYGGGIAALAEAVRRGDADEVLGVLRARPAGVTWADVDAGQGGDHEALAAVREQAVATARRVTEAAQAGAAAQAIEALGAFRVLCAHRRGDHGVAAWTARIEGWLAAALEGFAADGRWYVGRPLLVTRNDHGLRLYNGDTGVVVAAAPGEVAAAFGRGGELQLVGPARLEAVETVYAMTVHKSQGSQFRTAAVLLPEPTSRVLTRELLYTAVTRAQEQLVLAGTEAAVRAAVSRPVARASGLRDRLWG
jgi:exodeoxyribonuclease V alpha subunit